MVDQEQAPRFVAEPAVCHACAERSAAARAEQQDNEGAHLDGWYWGITQRQRTNGAG